MTISGNTVLVNWKGAESAERYDIRMRYNQETMNEITFNPDDFTPEAIRKQRALCWESAKDIAPQLTIKNGCPYQWTTTSEPQFGVAIVLHDSLIDGLLDDPERLKATLMLMAEDKARDFLRDFNMIEDTQE